MLVPRGRKCSCPEAVSHQVAFVPEFDVTVVQAIPVTTPTRTIIDVASVLDPDPLEIALDDMIRRRLTSVARIQWRLATLGRSGRRGTIALRELLADRPAKGPQSPLETQVRQLIRKSPLPMPVSQHPVFDAARLVAVVDFAYPDLRIAIEADGYEWHSGKGQWRHDLERRNRLVALGWRVIHLTAADAERTPDRAIATVERVFREQARRA
ncbi:MAG: DUF559 domain-containing protein [Actinobacteria bacterium]|nr:DUF559 domain-containing protein [Actinomycetota bacterium]